MKQIKLKELKFGDTFKRKLNAKYSYSKGKYYKGNSFDPTGYECTQESDCCRSIYLKGYTTVYIDEQKKVIELQTGETVDISPSNPVLNNSNTSNSY